jgi:hypothetical protein
VQLGTGILYSLKLEIHEVFHVKLPTLPKPCKVTTLQRNTFAEYIDKSK